MNDFVKYVWMILFLIGCFGIVTHMPYDMWRQAYMDELHKIQIVPIKRIDATTRYIEAIENGQEDISNGILPTPPKKYYRNISYKDVKRIGRVYIYDGSNFQEHAQPAPQQPVKNYKKPMYRRDKDNPNVLYRVN